MVTEQEYIRGKRCKGAGLNCPKCKTSSGCYQLKKMQEEENNGKKDMVNQYTEMISELEAVKDVVADDLFNGKDYDKKNDIVMTINGKQFNIELNADVYSELSMFLKEMLCQESELSISNRG